MYGNQLARNSQVQAARARLAARQGYVPGGADYANMAGCGPVAPSMIPPGSPLGVLNVPGGGAGLPPIPYPGPAIFQQGCVPCSVIMQADLGGATEVQVSPRNGAFFNIGGISSCNNCFEILINSILTGSAEVNLLPCGQVDVGIWNTDDCFCCFDGGCISTLGPATINFEPFGTPSVAPFLNIALWGVSTRVAFDCGWPYGVGGPYVPFLNGYAVGGVPTGPQAVPYGFGGPPVYTPGAMPVAGFGGNGNGM